MVKELPGTTQEFDEYIPLSRVQVFSTKDDSMSLNIFVFGEEKLAPTEIEEKTKLLEYAQQVQEGQFINDDRHPKPSPLFNRVNILNYLHHCSEPYVDALSRVAPRRFLTQMQLFHQVSGSEGMAVHVEVCGVMASFQSFVLENFYSYTLSNDRNRTRILVNIGLILQ